MATFSVELPFFLLFFHVDDDNFFFFDLIFIFLYIFVCAAASSSAGPMTAADFPISLSFSIYILGDNRILIGAEEAVGHGLTQRLAKMLGLLASLSNL